MDKNIGEAQRWMVQAEKDLRSARNSLASEDFEWACFQAQQSAEKSLKAVLYGRGARRIITHSVFELLREIDDPSLLSFRRDAKHLDSVYITTRYPDSIAGGLAPCEYFEEEDAEECIRSAEYIVQAARSLLPT